MLDHIPNAYHQELKCGEGCNTLTKRSVIIHRSLLDNDKYVVSSQLYPPVTISALPDDVLLEVAQFCVDEEFDLLHKDKRLMLVLKVERSGHVKFNPCIPLFIFVLYSWGAIVVCAERISLLHLFGLNSSLGFVQSCCINPQFGMVKTNLIY